MLQAALHVFCTVIVNYNYGHGVFYINLVTKPLVHASSGLLLCHLLQNLLLFRGIHLMAYSYSFYYWLTNYLIIMCSTVWQTLSVPRHIRFTMEYRTVCENVKWSIYTLYSYYTWKFSAMHITCLHDWLHINSVSVS